MPPPTSRGGLDTFEPSGPADPHGAQRALSVLRRFVDEAGARRRGVRAADDRRPALAAPDQAVVAAFERIDVVVADPMREIVTGRVDPDRALADHVFAHRLLRRAGTRVLVPAGPLLVTPDLERGVPSDPATRSGRALALQLLGGGAGAAGRACRRDPSSSGRCRTGSWTSPAPRAGSRRGRAPARAAPRPPPRVRGAGPPRGAGRTLARARRGAAPRCRRCRPRAARSGGHTGACHRPDARIRRRGHGAACGPLGHPSCRARPRSTPSARSRRRWRRSAALEDRGWGAVVDQPLAAGAAGLGAEAVAERTGAFDALAVDLPRPPEARPVASVGRGSVRPASARRARRPRPRRSQVGQCQRASSGVPHTLVAERLADAAAPRSPVGEQVERTRELAAVDGQRVLHAERPPRVGRRDEDPGPLEAAEAVRQDVRRDARARPRRAR